MGGEQGKQGKGVYKNNPEIHHSPRSYAALKILSIFPPSIPCPCIIFFSLIRCNIFSRLCSNVSFPPPVKVCPFFVGVRNTEIVFCCMSAGGGTLFCAVVVVTDFISVDFFGVSGMRVMIFVFNSGREYSVT